MWKPTTTTTSKTLNKGIDVYVVKIRQTDTQPSTKERSLSSTSLFSQRTRLMYCTPPLQYGTPPPPSPMPHSLREMAGRWCHHFVCLVLTMEVYDKGYPWTRSKVIILLSHAAPQDTRSCFRGTLAAVWPDWAIYYILGNFSKPLETIILPKTPTFLGNFCKGIKIFNFSSEIIFGQLL